MIIGICSNTGNSGILTASGANIVAQAKYTGTAGSSPYPDIMFILDNLTSTVNLTCSSSTSSSNSNGKYFAFE